MDYEALISTTEELMEQGEWETALNNAREAVRRNRLNLRANYLLAVCAENMGEWLESYRYYSILCRLQEKYENPMISLEQASEKIDKVLNEAIHVLQGMRPGAAETARYKNELLAVNEQDKSIEKNYFEIYEHIDGYFGIHRYFGREYYIGKYNAWFPYYLQGGPVENAVCLKSEIYETAGYGNSVAVDERMTSFPCVVPIVATENTRLNNISVENILSGDVWTFPKGYAKGWGYYRLEEPALIRAEDPMVIGKPVPLRHKEGNKRLVLNIFIDSLNYKCIREDKLREYMPYTYEFFKNGVICNEFYAGSEYTYPSTASYWTGLRPARHQMINVGIHYSIYEDIPLLSEIFRDNGYFTAKMGGNADLCPQHGYIRGIDRFLYGDTEAVFHADACVSEAIEHMEAFAETDQFLWIDFQDLHYVAGYWPVPLSVEAHLPVEVNEIDNIGGSSLYQTPSPHRRSVYEGQLRYVDRQLKVLYDYVLEHYAEDEIVVSLISDHGNGFNVDDGNYFICEQRMNVPLMLRGGGLSAAVCDERIETIDYGHIMAKLAGICDERLSGNDGQLPMFFGGNREKEYVFSQSLFPDRYYSAMILGQNYKFYIESETKVESDCRISLKGALVDLRDADGMALTDEEILNACMKIVEEQLGDFKIG